MISLYRKTRSSQEYARLRSHHSNTVVTELDLSRKEWNRVVSFRAWLGLGIVLGLVLGLVLELVIGVSFSVNSNPNPNLTLKLTTRFQSFLGNLILEYPV